MNMLFWKLKNCTRCGGDVFVDRDMDGWFMQCLQCSHRTELEELKNQPIPIRVKPTPLEDWSKEKKYKNYFIPQV